MNRRKQQEQRQPPGERRPSRKRIVWGAIVVLLNCVLLFRLCSADKESDSGAKATKEQYWLNYDPDRPVTDILNYDYDNRMIIYRDTGRFSDTPSPTPDEGEKKRIKTMSANPSMTTKTTTKSCTTTFTIEALQNCTFIFSFAKTTKR